MEQLYYYDSTLYRESEEEGVEAWIDGAWKAIVPSEQDYDSMRKVTPAQAAELVPGAELGA